MSDEINKEFVSLIENETLTVCKEKRHDKRTFVLIQSELSLSSQPSSSSSSSTTSTAAATVTSTTTQSSQTHHQPQQQNGKNLPIIYFVTPTYPRREQIAELTRLGQTLMHVENLFWIVADDTEACNTHLEKILDNFGKHFQNARNLHTLFLIPLLFACFFNDIVRNTIVIFNSFIRLFV